MNYRTIAAAIAVLALPLTAACGATNEVEDAKPAGKGSKQACYDLLMKNYKAGENQDEGGSPECKGLSNDEYADQVGKVLEANLDDFTEDPEEATDDTYTLADTVTYENNIEVSLSGIKRGTSSAYASPENTPYVKFNVKVINGTDETIDMSEMYLLCQYGDEGKDGEEIYDSEQGLDGTPMTHLRPGRSSTALIACELPKSQTYLQIEITPTFDSEAAIFAGDVN